MCLLLLLLLKMASLEGLGTHVFKGAVAAPYLTKQGLPPNTLESGDWAKDSRADQVLFVSALKSFF